MSRLIAVVLLLVTVAVSWPVLEAGTIYEDGHASGYRLGQPWQWRPSQALTRATWALQINQTDRSRHAVNLALHLVAGSLVGMLGGLFAMGVFLLHPIQSEAVGYLASRADVLMTMGLLVTVIALRRGWTLVALGAALCAMWSKESGVAVVGLVWLFGRRPVRIAVTLAAVAAVPLAWALIKAFEPSWLTQQAAGLWSQIVGLLLPWTLMLAPDPSPLSIVSTTLLLAGVGLVAVWLWRTNRRLACGWIVLTLGLRFLVPTPGSVLNNHQMYAPLAGLCLVGVKGRG